MTHGEAYYLKKSTIDFKADISNILRNLDRLPPRMERQKAIEYYSNKLRAYFGVDEVSPRDFRNIDEFYDYHYTMRLRSKNG